ncbi:hypothetical protein E2K73_08660 [Acinetobacter sp. RF15A]|uniref:hypothetical protein n=1 Tax=unclassified Acinetobacter TaxID=196816 RepID=UPI00116F398F|nr:MULTISPECIES: hypothetical protein [unclassified Acinetobacter]TQR66025.1 hypothetical protein E2K52_05870 [Acinetobacter sp. RF14B]TSH74713.1 hypothetical protein E2K73_08660 [Acinetobacter sp. RF15A]TSI17285.1 hypothetical protein E2K74_09525 [Acinetobacter sp. RF15B]
MKAMTKVGLIGASIVSMGLLSACQSTSQVPDSKEHPHMMKHHEQHAAKKAHQLSPEQREHYRAMRTERMQLGKQMQQACEGKTIGSTVQVKAGDKTIEGQCNIFFKADRKEMKQRGEFRGMRGEHRPMQGNFRGGMNGADVLTDTKRAELVKQYDQYLAERQALQTAFARACQGQAPGKAVQVKIADQTINGQCMVRFQPKAPVATAASQ